MRLDSDIKKDVVDQIYWDSRVNAADVKVEVLDGVVTLSGSVPTYTAKANAVADAWLVDGVKDVEDELTVLIPSEITPPSDEEIRTNIKSKLVWNPEIYSNDIKVSVKDGHVTLEGNVEAYWKKWKVEDIASEVQGVVEVENKLAIVPSGTWHDEDVAEDIVSSLSRNRFVDEESITVKVDKGHATLTGAVSNWYERMQAENAAKYTSGVTEVENQIAVV